METVTTIGGAILSVSLKALFDKLASHDLLQYARQEKVLAEIEKWESMLRKIYAVLDDAEEKQLTNQLVKIWVSELRDLAYDVEDVLDEFATEALRRRLVVKPLAITNKVKKSIPTCFGVNPRTVKFNSKLLSKMEEITARLEKITAGKHDLDLRESTGRRSNRVRKDSPQRHWGTRKQNHSQTRNQGVSLMMGNVLAYPLKELSDDDCLAVFAQHALGAKNFDAHSKLEEIGKKIAKRCQGLPLAAKALGGLLRGKLDCNVWKEVLNSKIWDLPEEKNVILPALRLSYHHLPSHLKRCFASCAVFPKDYKFDKKELVLLWMAEGFLRQPNEMKPIEDLGHEYFHDLLSRSFFQQSSNKDTCLMHDLIRNLARSVNE
ncbi:hypothetical protein GH714_001135 [Hevea brasiliensis]|uniref:Rx N-terminal domain-containing protein n=1 Tax=Hevea brasiliensis TaxID=3981 RepID=A0A6A6M686_HEVBR|nr:hypothetical protein GH714_001135 [Hevea brasiliensis]